MKKSYNKLNIPMLKIRNKSKGFTLIEIIIAFALFGIMMGGIYGIVISAMNTNKAGEVKQKAALYGQQIFEDIKSGDMKNIDDINYELSGINLEDISSGQNKLIFNGSKVLENGYIADIILEKNNSVYLDEDENASEGGSENNELENNKVYQFEFDVTTLDNQSSVRIQSKNDSDKDIVITNINDKLKFVVKSETALNKKNILIQSENESNNLQDSKLIEENEKNIPIKLNFSLYGFKLIKSSNEKEYKDVIIEVYNKDKIPLSIELKKEEDLNIKLISKEGKIRLYDNRSENEESRIGELYNITVNIKNSKGKSEFTGHATYNVYIK